MFILSRGVAAMAAFLVTFLGIAYVGLMFETYGRSGPIGGWSWAPGVFVGLLVGVIVAGNVCAWRIHRDTRIARVIHTGDDANPPVVARAFGKYPDPKEPQFSLPGFNLKALKPGDEIQISIYSVTIPAPDYSSYDW